MKLLLDECVPQEFRHAIAGHIPHQQNVATLPVAVVIIEADSNDVNDLKVMVPALLTTLQNLQPRTLAYISAKP